MFLLPLLMMLVTMDLQAETVNQDDHNYLQRTIISQTVDVPVPIPKINLENIQLKIFRIGESGNAVYGTVEIKDEGSTTVLVPDDWLRSLTMQSMFTGLNSNAIVLNQEQKVDQDESHNNKFLQKKNMQELAINQTELKDSKNGYILQMQV